MAYNPFTECEVVEREASLRRDSELITKQSIWYVESKYWRVQAASEEDAKRIAEIIRGAYKSGADSDDTEETTDDQ